MLEVEDKIIKMLKNGATFAKLQTKTGLTSSKLAHKLLILKNKGYVINKEFHEHGVKLWINNQIIHTLQDNISINCSNKFTFIALADTHIGNIYENMDAVKLLYKYALDKNIEYVVNLGDITEGTSLKDGNDSRIKRFTLNEQIDFLTRNYPKYDTINTLYILGNHDERWLNTGMDISKIIDNRRYDMHCLGYKNSKITIGNKNILLHHPFSIERDHKYDKEIHKLYLNPEFDLVLRGHTHHNGIYINDMNSIVVHVPACYNSPTRKYTGAYQVTLRENDLELTQLIIGDEVHDFSHIRIPFTRQNSESNKCLEKVIK